MGYKVISELKRLRNLERGTIKSHHADYRVALVYPNSYYVGMSSLGFQLVYSILNFLPGVGCERSFYFAEQGSRTVESLEPLRNFDCVAFSLSYEHDYFNVAEILRRSNIRPLSGERSEEFPLIIGGGVCAWLNPEPLADIFDLFVLGEAEAVLPRLLRLFRESKNDRIGLLRSAAFIPGVYVPSLFKPEYGPDDRFVALDSVEENLPLPGRQWIDNLDEWPACAPIVTPETDFGGKILLEVMRGCRRRCRFCVADYAYRSPRIRSPGALMGGLEDKISLSRGVAVQGPCLTDHPEIEKIFSDLLKRFDRISISSVRADSVSDSMLELLVKGGLKSLTIAPETPSEKLQRRLNKWISHKKVLQTAEKACASGIKELKLYYMIGIAGEGKDDLESIVEQVGEISSLIPVRVSVGPLIPKAHTPLQWMGIQQEKQLREKNAFLQKEIAKIKRVRISGSSVRWAMMEACLARGDRRMAGYIIDGKVPRNIRDKYALAEYNRDEPFPWEHIDTGVFRRSLLGEYKKFLRSELTAP